MRAVVLVDHGSRAKAANAQLDVLTEQIAAALPDCRVLAAHMEIAEPSLGSVLEQCIAEGATEIRVHPFFVAPGRHVREDIPRIIREACVQHPEIEIRLTEPLGLHPSVIEAVLSRIADADGSS